MFYVYPSQPRWYSAWNWLIVLLIIAPIVYSGIRYFLDRGNYTKGHQACLQLNCAEAISYFDNVLTKWRLSDIGGYATLAKQERAECASACVSARVGVEREQRGDFGGALWAYNDFMTSHGSSFLVEVVRNRAKYLFKQTDPFVLAKQGVCKHIDTLLGNNLLSKSDAKLPELYFRCGQRYADSKDHLSAITMYEQLLRDYPNHSLASEAQAALVRSVSESLLNQTSSYTLAKQVCDRIDAFVNRGLISKHNANLPAIYFRCGRIHEDIREYANAIARYEQFLRDYPNHPLASEVKAALARAIVADAGARRADELPPPERIGSTIGGYSVVTIQNDSPERLQIVFSGPEARIEELQACALCSTYTESSAPLHCPERGPIGRYTLKPGQYDVVVRSLSDISTIPWRGSWSLSSGDEYHSCLIIVIKSDILKIQRWKIPDIPRWKKP